MSDMPWGLPEKVEDNVHADVQPETHHDAQHPAHDAVMTTGKRTRDAEAGEVGKSPMFWVNKGQRCLQVL